MVFGNRGSNVYRSGGAAGLDAVAVQALIDAAVDTDRIVRADAVRNVAPTAAEYPTPDDGDSALIRLADDTLEIWTYAAGVWTLAGTHEPGATNDLFRELAQWTPTAGASPIALVDRAGYTTVRVEDPGGDFSRYETTDNLPDPGQIVRIKFLKGTAPAQVMYLRAVFGVAQHSDLRVNVADGSYITAQAGGMGLPTVLHTEITDHTVEVWVEWPAQAWAVFQLFPSVAGSTPGPTGTVDLIALDMNSAAPARDVVFSDSAGSAHLVSSHTGQAVINNTNVVTGHDLTAMPGMTLKLWLADSGTSLAWDIHELDVDMMLARYNAGQTVDAYIHTFDVAFVRIEVIDPATGELNFVDQTRNMDYVRSELWVTAQIADYSTTEHVTGRRWIDGKEVYEVVIDCSAAANGATILPAGSIETMIHVSGSVNNDTNIGLQYAAPYSATSMFQPIRQADGSVELRRTQSFDIPQPGDVLILEYTKP